MKYRDQTLKKFRHLVRLLLRRTSRFSGNFENWILASNAAGGYDNPRIAKKSFEAARFSFENKTKAERDGVVLDQAPAPFPMLVALLLSMLDNKTKLSVVDFGGGFGTHYYQALPFLGRYKSIHWYVVEQPLMVELASSHFSDEGLFFGSCLEKALESNKPNIVIFSGVLQYIENPADVINAVIRSGVQYVFVDRTPFINKKYDEISVQRVPKVFGEASYPVRLFSDVNFKNYFPGFEEVSEFEAIDGVMGFWGRWIDFKGMILRRVDKQIS